LIHHEIYLFDKWNVRYLLLSVVVDSNYSEKEEKPPEPTKEELLQKRFTYLNS
jgi:hypothetical protein